MANTLSDLAAEMERADAHASKTAVQFEAGTGSCFYWDGVSDGFEHCAAMLRRYIADHGEG